MRKTKTTLLLVLAAMAMTAAGCGGCGGDESANDPALPSAADITPGATTDAGDPQQTAAQKAARAKVFAAVLEDIEEDRDEVKKTLVRPERSKFIPQPEKLDEDQIEPAPSSGKRVSTGFASFEIPEGWSERSAQRSEEGSKPLTQLVPSDEVKADDSDARYSAVITVQELPKSPVWADATEKDMIQYAMLYDSADPLKAVSMSLDGSPAVGFGFDDDPSRATSVYSANSGNLFQINGAKTNPADDPSAVQAAVLTVVNTWSWD